MKLKLKLKKLIVAGAVIASLFAALAPSRARVHAQTRQLPEFQLETGGQLVPGVSSLGSDRTIVAYVAPSCRSCDLLLEALGGWESGVRERIVIVVKGDGASAASYLDAKLPEQMRQQVRWFSDPSGEAAAALGVHAVPMLVAIDRGAVDWTLGGVLGQPRMLEGVARSWVEGASH